MRWRPRASPASQLPDQFGKVLVAPVPQPRHGLAAGGVGRQINRFVHHGEHLLDLGVGGAEVVELLKTGSAFYAPGSSIAKMVEAILNDTHEVMSVCAYLEGEYGIEDTYMCVPVELGRNGVEKIVEFDVNEAELAELQASAASIAAQVDSLGLR